MIYNKVQELAIKKGLSFAEIERKAHLGNGTIGKWKNASPNIDSLYKVAEVLNVSVKTLLSEKNNEDPA